MLLCLAPFTSVIWTKGNILNNYTKCLKHQPILSALPFERWSEVICEAQNWGLLSPDPDTSGFLRLQPIFPYFLRNRLNMPEQAEVKNAIEVAFRQHYETLGDELYDLLESKEPQERQSGQLLTGLEYENLVTALKLVLTALVSIDNLYFTLSSYLDAAQDQRRGLELGQNVLTQLGSYTAEKLAGQLGFEFISVIDNIAMRQIELQQYKEAETSYQKALSLLLGNKSYNAGDTKKLSARIYHQLGIVAAEQRLWPQAEQYYKQALQLHIGYNDFCRQAETNGQLGNLAADQRQWSQAEQYYQRALQIYIEFNDPHAQAKAYLNLGATAYAQCHWPQVRDYYLRALTNFVALNDAHDIDIALYNLARFWQASGDVGLLAVIAQILNGTVEDAEARLHEVLGGK